MLIAQLLFLAITSLAQTTPTAKFKGWTCAPSGTPNQPMVTLLPKGSDFDFVLHFAGGVKETYKASEMDPQQDRFGKKIIAQGYKPKVYLARSGSQTFFNGVMRLVVLPEEKLGTSVYAILIATELILDKNGVVTDEMALSDPTEVYCDPVK